MAGPAKLHREVPDWLGDHRRCARGYSYTVRAAVRSPWFDANHGIRGTIACQI
jgi:hypothetical protein